MANAGRFIDRNPLICAAGRSTGTAGESVASNFRQYGIDDAIDGLKHQANIRKEGPSSEVPPHQDDTDTQINPAPNSQLESTCEKVIDNSRETSCDSLPAKASSVDNTFGGTAYKETPLKEVVNPPKPPYEVMWKNLVGHRKYIKTHEDYNPSDDINRKHSAPHETSDPFGTRSGVGSQGIWVRCWCDWHKKESLVKSSKIQADHLSRTRAVVGKAMTPNHVLEMFPKGHTFGKKTDGKFVGEEDVVEDHMSSPCTFKRDFTEWMSSLNEFKVLMEKQSNKPCNFDDFYEKCLFWDNEQTGLLPTKVFYDQCFHEDVTHLKDHLNSLLKLLKIIIDDKINYKGFIDILNSNKPPIEIIPFNDIPPDNQHFFSPTETVYADYLIINDADMPTAGLPSNRHDSSRPFNPNEDYRSDIDHLGEDTTENSLLSPSIFPHYEPTHKDFFEPRTAETMRELFEKVGYDFPGDTFEKLWKKGLEKDKTGSVCVDTFKTLVKNYCPPAKLPADKQE